MSFILDALRKSETDRQQQSAPGLANAQYRVARTRKNFWLPVVGVILAGNLIFLAVSYYDNSPDSTPQIEQNLPTVESPASPIPEPATTAVDRPAIQPESALTEKNDSADIAAAAIPDSAVIDSPPINVPDPQRGNVIQEDLPTLVQLTLSGIVTIPALHMDIHVFSSKPANRFVFINTQKYKEGDVVKEGPVVEEITATGVILDQRGNRFIINRD
jgi:general secretion pathway protein B